MNEEHNLTEFAAILAAKGYDNSFLTNASYPDSLKESIRRYLDACSHGEDELRENKFSLTSYIKYSHEDNPYVVCWMGVSYQNEKFRLTEMNISRKDEYGHLLKECKLTFTSTAEIPDKSTAVSMVVEPKQKKVRVRGL